MLSNPAAFSAWSPSDVIHLSNPCCKNCSTCSSAAPPLSRLALAPLSLDPGASACCLLCTFVRQASLPHRPHKFACLKHSSLRHCVECRFGHLSASFGHLGLLILFKSPFGWCLSAGSRLSARLWRPETRKTRQKGNSKTLRNAPQAVLSVLFPPLGRSLDEVSLWRQDS